MKIIPIVTYRSRVAIPRTSHRKRCLEPAATLFAPRVTHELSSIHYYPYYYRHYPTTKHTAVAETPESRRIAQNTKLQSNVSAREGTPLTIPDHT